MTNPLIEWEGTTRELDSARLAEIHEMVSAIKDELRFIAAARSHDEDFTEFQLDEPRKAAGNEPEANDNGQQLPDPRLFRQILKLRRARAEHFPADLFADPAWDMLLDLAAARAEYKRISVTSLCLASGVATTTALRYVDALVSHGLCQRCPDESDRRRIWLTLTDKGVAAIAGYFARARSIAGMSNNISMTCI